MIGDVLATSILFEAIKQKYPKSELHYVINTHTYPVVEHNPYIDKIHFFTPKHENSILNLLKFSRQLKKENYDVVIDVYSKLSSNIITFLSKAKTKISIDKSYNALIYNRRYKNKTSSNTNAGLAIENRLQLLTPFNIDTENIVKPKIYLTELEKKQARALLISNGIKLDKPLVMIGVLGSSENKTYPFTYMAEVIDGIVSANESIQILFNYIPHQIEDAKAILELCNERTKKQIHFDVFGKGLRQFLAITHHCSALIGNEGGAVNMAKALNVPTFTIFSPWIKKEAWNMFDDGKKHTSVHLKDFKPEVYTGVNHPKLLKQEAKALYQKFEFKLFKKQVGNFLKLNLN